MYDITRPLLSFKQIFTINVKYTHSHTHTYIHTRLYRE